MEGRKNIHQQILKKNRTKVGHMVYLLDRGSTWEHQENFLLLNEQVVVKMEVCKNEDSLMVKCDGVINNQLVQVGNVKEEIVESKADIFCNIVTNLLSDDAELLTEKEGEDKELDASHEDIHNTKMFDENSCLNVHVVSHTDEKKDECGVCHGKFGQSGNLKCHMLTHTNEKKHKCDVCQKKFALKGNLKVHMFTHTNGDLHKIVI